MTTHAIRSGLLALTFALGGCTGAHSTASNSANVSNAAVPVTESTGTATMPPATTIEMPESLTRTLDGTIGSLPVRMRLTKDKSGLLGEYVYETGRAAMRTVVGMLSLEGTVDSAGTVRISESASDMEGNETKTGVFEGTLTNTNLGLRFVGTWKKPDGSGSMPVVLNELTSTPGGIRFVSANMPSPDKRLASVVKVAYPRAEGGDSQRAAAFTTAVEGLVRERVREFTADAVENLGEDLTVDMLALEIDYEIATATDDVVSVVFTEYSNFGGAHPSSGVTGRTFEFARGRFLTLTDLTGDTRSLLAVISQKCRAILPKDEVFQAELDPKAENFSEWYVTRRGMTFVFSIPHVAGDTMQAYLPFADIKSALNPDGPLGPLIR